MKQKLKKSIALLTALVLFLSCIRIENAAPVHAGEIPAGSEEITTTTEYVFLLEASDLTAFAAEAKSDGDIEKAGTDKYFSIIYSKKSKVDSSTKEFDDGYTSSQRINLGGKATTSLNSVKINTVASGASVTVWWAAGDNGRQMTALNSSGTNVATTAESSVKNSAYKSTMTLGEAGTYYIGGNTGNNYIFKIEVMENRTETKYKKVYEYTLNTSDLTSFSAGAKSDGSTEIAGTDDYFAIIYSSKSKVDSSTKTFDDNYTSIQRINFGGAASTGKNSVKITTTSSDAVVKIWWVEAGDDNRQMAVLNSSGSKIAVTEGTYTKNAAYISSLKISDAGTYYIGGYENNNYIFRIVVTETVFYDSEGNIIAPVVTKPERASWNSVAAPAIISAQQNSANIDITVSAMVGYDGADGVNIIVSDSEGNTLTTLKSTAEADTHTKSYKPSKSGRYTFTAEAYREGEESLLSTSESVDFILPLTAPAINSVTSLGGGKVAIAWDAVSEAVYYVISVNGQDTLETAETSAVIEGLTIGSEYSFALKAARNAQDITAAGTSVSATVKDEKERVWAFSVFGTSTDTKNNGYTGSANDGSVTVYSEGGKGKIVPNSTDGIAFYYTALDPVDDNFVLRAKVNVDKWTYSNGQEGFGLLVSDTIGTNGKTDTVWTNSIMALASKIEYNYDSAAGTATSDTSCPKISMKLGIGSLVRLGVTAKDVSSFNSAGTFTMSDGTTGGTPENFTSATHTLETSCGENGSGTYNIIGNYTTAPSGDQGQNDVTSLVLEISRNNTAYYVRYYSENGTLIGEDKIFDIDRKALAGIDPDKVYVGFFAARNARITVTDITLTTSYAPDDAPAEVREVKYDGILNAGIESANTANSSNYDLVFYGNADGTLTVRSDDGTVIADSVNITANTKKHITVDLKQGSNTFIAAFTPDPAFMLSEYQGLESYESVSYTHTVEFRTFDREYIYIAPDGKSGNTGSKESPLDIYTAVKYAAPGQILIITGDKYDLNATVTVPRGINGTEEKPIYLIAESYLGKTNTDGSLTASSENIMRPVFDFGGNCAGFVAAGDHWVFEGFDVTGSADGQKGFQLSGSNNIIAEVNTYRNGNTGLQISRYKGSDKFEDWPANNLILNCTSYLNADKGYEDADGFAAKLTIGEGNVFDGCISVYNADDGWDLYAKVETGSIGKVIIKNSIAFKNGYVLDASGNEIYAGNGNGFKMGGESLPGSHTLINSIAFANKAKGIDSNSCPDIKVYNSTAFDNGSYNIALYTNNAVNTDYVAEGVITFNKTSTTTDNIKTKGTQDVTKVNNPTNFFVAGTGVSKNSEGNTIDESIFENIDVNAVIEGFKNYINNGVYEGIARNSDGIISTGGFLAVSESIGAGAVTGGTATGSVVKTIAAETVAEEPSTGGSEVTVPDTNEPDVTPSEDTTVPSSDKTEDAAESEKEPEKPAEVLTEEKLEKKAEEAKAAAEEKFSGTEVEATAADPEETVSVTRKNGVYVDSEGEPVKDSFVTTAKGNTLFVDSEGKVAKSTIVVTIDPETGKSSMFYTAKNGAVVKDKMVTLKDGSRLFAGEDGKIVTKEIITLPSGKSYYAGKDGSIARSQVIRFNGQRLYADKYGRLVKDKLVTSPAGKQYYATEDGTLALNRWVTVNGIEYWCNKKGIITKSRKAE